MWFQEMVAPDEVAFEAGVFLLRKATAEALRAGQPATPAPTPEPEPGPTTTPAPEPGPRPAPDLSPPLQRGRCASRAPSLPRCGIASARRSFRSSASGSELKIGLEFSVTVSADSANGLAAELRQILQELGLAEAVKVE